MNMMSKSAAQLDAALARVVSDDGRVDYAALSTDGSALACARDMETFDLETLQARAEKLAFWINAYNCLALVSVLKRLTQNPAYRGVMHRGYLDALRFFYLNRYMVGGRKLSLTTIENRILRGELQEPRIHFALVCASASCPPLKRGLYSAENIETELDMAARNFIRSPKGVHVERETHTVWLSPIFKWYRKDFERDAGSVVNYVARYLDNDERAYLARHSAQVQLRYLQYDWTLNRLPSSVAVEGS